MLDTQANVGVEFTSADLALSLDDFSARVLKPAARHLAAKIDSDGLFKMYQATYNQVGTPGTAFTSLDLFYDAMIKLQNNLAGLDDLSMVVNTRTWTKASSLMMNLFAPKSGDEVIKNFVAKAIGFDWYMDSNVVTHTPGNFGAGAKTVNGAGQSGATLAITGLPASTIGAVKVGDVFTIAGVFAVQPNTKVVLPDLQQFVVVADATSAAGGTATLSIQPAIVTSGAYQNVSAGPATGAAITFAGTANTPYQLGLAFHPDAYVLATAKLESSAASPENIIQEYDPETGIAVTFERWRDARSGTDLNRVDVLYGWAALRPELAVRVVNA